MVKQYGPKLPFLKPRCWQTGSIVIEFTILIPFMLLFVFGTVELGLMLFDKAVVTNASREAARSAIAFRTPPLPSANIQDIATAYCNQLAISLGGTSNCLVTPAPVVPAIIITGQSNISVTVSYTYTPLILGSLLSLISTTTLANSIVLTSTTKMFYE